MYKCRHVKESNCTVGRDRDVLLCFLLKSWIFSSLLAYLSFYFSDYMNYNDHIFITLGSSCHVYAYE
jgi:hypothetical protein